MVIIIMNEIDAILNLIRHGESLKIIERTGWKIAGVKRDYTESVAEHSYGCSFIAMVVANHLKAKGVVIDIGKVAILAILHDLPESITGDIARTREFSEDMESVRAKEIAERNAIDTILGPLGKPFKNINHLWNEFNENKSAEAIIVKAADIIDMLIHARQLEALGTPAEMLHQFFVTSKSIIEEIDLDIVTAIYTRLRAEHEAELEDSS
jgi:putative hydrolase of HD superfamily